MLAYVESKNAKVFPIGLRVETEFEKMLQIFGILIITTVEIPQQLEDGSINMELQQNGRFIFLPGWFTEEFRESTESTLKEKFHLQFVEIYHHMDNNLYIGERNSEKRNQILDALNNKEIFMISN
ncbi:MAG TPA: hypothetical protein VJ824_04530 [Bacillota bacterium]|nr:hypothetical protein [Bacillota bacterium]